MQAQLIEISAEEFARSAPEDRLFSHDYPRRFGRLVLPNSRPGPVMNWRSDIVEPSVLVDVETGTTWIGIDERMAAVGAAGETVFSTKLYSYLFTLQQAGGCIIAICELQALIVNRRGDIKQVFDFPDIVEQFTLTDEALTVTVMGDGRKFVCKL